MSKHDVPRVIPETKGRVAYRSRMASLGKYTLVRLIGKGGMGCVYEAFDTSLERRVAIKILSEAQARNVSGIRRFIAEARAFARVNHPNTVTILDVDRRAGTTYLVMELMTGGNLQQALKRRGALAWPDATRGVIDGCRALVATHAAGLVHRDVKPSNLMCAQCGTVKLADFGLATDVHASQPAPGTGNSVVGTPQFMSPEQCRGEPADGRSDLYGLGATYYALLVGGPPYVARLPLQAMFAHCAAPVPDPRDVDVRIPAACAEVVRRAMAKEPTERYQSAEEMLEGLERCLYGAPDLSAGTPTPRAAAQGDLRVARH